MLVNLVEKRHSRRFRDRELAVVQQVLAQVTKDTKPFFAQLCALVATRAR